MKTIILAILCMTLTATGAAADQFSQHWHDGKAELDGYNLKVERYGETREGTAVMIFVTEPFSESKRVKVDDPKRNPDDTIDVLKLNLVRDFQTGIYDYNTMVSVFARTSDFDPVKVSFSSAEWCGHVYEELIFNPGRVHGNYFSYFEGESGPIELKRPRGGVSEDNLFILLRGLRGDYLAAGESKTVNYLPGAFVSRLWHKPLAWSRATISRDANNQSVEVPAGKFDTMVYRVDAGAGRVGVFHIEADYPHRIVKWEFAPDVVGELTGSSRLQYWKLHDNGDERYLDDIGLGEASR